MSCTPEPTSDPCHCTVKLGESWVAPIGVTVLTGLLLSIVFIHVGVLIGAFVSNTMVALLRICVPVDNPSFGLTEKLILPSPTGGSVSGGRKPLKSLGGWLVTGSSDVNVTVSVFPTSFASILTM